MKPATSAIVLALALATPLLAQPPQTVQDEYAVYDLLAPESASFRTVYEVAVTTPGVRIFPDRIGSGLTPVQGNPMMEVIGKLMQNGGLILHGEQEFEYHRPIVAGDVLRSEGKVVDAYEKESKGKTMTFVVTETVWSDDKTGEPVLTARFNLIHRA